MALLHGGYWLRFGPRWRVLRSTAYGSGEGLAELALGEAFAADLREAAGLLLRELADATGFPVTSTLMGLGAYPAAGKGWIGMLGMHGLYEANMAMHDCDLMIAVGARFDDRITGRVADFSPGSVKAQIDIDPSSINKVIHVDLPIVGDVGHVLEDLLKVWKSRGRRVNQAGPPVVLHLDGRHRVQPL